MVIRTVSLFCLVFLSHLLPLQNATSHDNQSLLSHKTSSFSEKSYKGPGVFGDVTIDVRLILRTPDETAEDNRHIAFELTLNNQLHSHSSYQKVQKIIALNPRETLLSYHIQTETAQGLGKTTSRKIISRKNPITRIAITAFLKQTGAMDSFLKGTLIYKYRYIVPSQTFYDQHISLPQQADFLVLETAVPENTVAYIYDFENNLLSRGTLGESAFMRHYQRLARLEHYQNKKGISPVTILRIIPWNIQSTQ